MGRHNKYTNKLPNHEAIRSLAQWAFCDSHVELDKEELAKVVNADVAACGQGLSEQDCERFVIGDEEGTVPEDLITRYPRTHAFLAKHWE